MMSDRRIAGAGPVLVEGGRHPGARVPELQPLLGVSEAAKESSEARAGVAGADGGPVFRRQLEIAQSFEKYWALYQVYCEAALDSEKSFVPVEFQCAVDGDSTERLSGIATV